MSDYLIIRIGNDTGDLANWIAVDSNGTRLSPPVTGPLEEAVKDVGDRSVIVLVPGADILTTTVDLPISSGLKLQAALPYALEEFVADDVDRLHFVAGPKRDSGRMPVSVVNRAILDAWLERLHSAGLQVASIVADSYGLARIPGTISLLVAEDQVIINDGSDLELVMQGVSPGDALTAIGAFDDGTGDHKDNDALPRHVLIYCDPVDEQRYQHDWIALQQEFGSLDVKLLSDGVMPRMAVTVASGAGVNLLQGDYGNRTDFAAFLRPWKLAAVLLVTLGVIGIGAKAAETYALTRELASVQQLFLSEYQQVVAGAAMPRDPQAAVRSLMASAGGNQSSQVLLQSLEQLAKALKQSESAKVEAISFRAGVVDVRLDAANVSALDEIQKSISGSGRFVASIQSTDQNGDRVNSRIQVKAGGL